MSGVGDCHECVLCDEVFETGDKLDFHFKTVHQRLYVCTNCPNFTSMFKFKLDKHLESAHDARKPKEQAIKVWHF